MEYEFKPKFIERYSALTDFEKFKEYSFKRLRRAIRVNTLKISVEEVVRRLSPEWELTPVPWCKEGFWIEHRGIGEEKRRDVGNLKEHMLGYIYVQEPASMLPPLVLDAQPGDLVLDMCAAPGSKTSQIAMMMKGEGFLVANDYKGDRLAALGINLQRVGAVNSMTNLGEGRYFKDFKFDRILVDAPCSGTGTIRKSLKTIQIWNPNMVRRLAGTQRQLARTAFDNLKEGGTMVYSTCSCEPEEDEAVVSHLLEIFPNAEVQDIDLPIKRGAPVMSFGKKEFHPDVAKTLRLWPQDNDTEGFFVAKIKKLP
ncbi:RsmB/NOP family class I SAM-dependent RNA methyltransferase [Candidatus Woesearchaeota archaeon]|nr:RsmB/NOP family class I SAM-dependent RNA methyltransferase [Candidatus Woesearchaeota archaeon]